MASSVAPMVRMFLSTISRLPAMAIAHCRKAMQWNSKLCRVRKDRKQPKYKKQHSLQRNNYGPAGMLPSAGLFVAIVYQTQFETGSHYNHPMDNQQIARILRETAQLLEI